MSSNKETVRDRGLIIEANRITLKKKTMKRLNLQEGDYWESQTYGDDQLLIRFNRTSKR